MKKYIIGRKLGMTQIFTPDGKRIAVTVIQAGPCTVMQIKTIEHDGYEAIQVAFEDIKVKSRVSKPDAGQFKKVNTAPKRFVREFRVTTVDAEPRKVGDIITCDVFAEGDVVDVTSRTKGHGYSGVIKRWNHARVGSMSHGSGPIHRSVGSVGANTFPAHVFKNRQMPGQFGCDQVTIQNLTIVKVDKEKNCLLVKGSVPGAEGALVSVRTAVKVQKAPVVDNKGKGGAK